MSIVSGPNVFFTLTTNRNPQSYYGPFESTANPGNLYVVFPAAGGLEIYHSASLTGTSWNLVGTITSSSGNFALEALGYDPVAGNIMLVYFQQGDVTLQLATYQVDSGTTTTVDMTSVFSIGSNISSMAIGALSDGTLFIALQPGGATNVRFVTYNGVFSAVHSLGVIGGALNHFQAMPTSGTSAYLFATFTNFRVFKLNSDGTFSGPSQVSASAIFPTSYGQNSIVFGGQVFIGAQNNSHIYRSSDLTATAFVSSLSAGFPANLIQVGSDLYAIYNAQAFSGPTLTQDQIIVRKYLGSDVWDTATVLADFITDPPPFVPPGDYFTGAHFVSDTGLSDGTIGLNSNFYSLADLCVPFYTQLAFTPPLTLDCGSPPDGQTGKPYTHTFAASGGTPPYTYAQTGGSPPPGLSLSTDGVLSGIPELGGTYSFTITVTDSLSISTSVTCTIVVLPTVFIQAGGGGVGDQCCGAIVPRPRCFENVPLLRQRLIIQSFLRKRRR